MKIKNAKSVLVKFFIIAILFIYNLETAYSQTFASIKDQKAEFHKELNDGYYIIIGVFSNFENAKKYTSELAYKGYTPDFAFSSGKSKYYSYLFHCKCLDTTRSKFTEIQKKDEFAKAWVLKVENGNETNINDQLLANKELIIVNEKDKIATSEKHHPQHHHGHHHKDLSATHDTYTLYVNVQDAGSKEVPTQVKIINGEKAHVVTTIQSHQEVTLNYPKNDSKNIQLVCEVFGYHKTVFDLKLDELHRPQTVDYIKTEGDKITVNIALQKYKKGDIMSMYNVFFYTNTNIMRIKSNYELQKLLTILNENPSLKIKIHGHTNGNSYGEITKISDNSTNFFDPEETEGIKGSSLKLSMLRAKTIKMFLVKNGITEDRIEIKGWGGKKMLYKENSPQHEYNVRVEIEILNE